MKNLRKIHNSFQFKCIGILLAFITFQLISTNSHSTLKWMWTKILNILRNRLESKKFPTGCVLNSLCTEQLRTDKLASNLLQLFVKVVDDRFQIKAWYANKSSTCRKVTNLFIFHLGNQHKCQTDTINC